MSVSRIYVEKKAEFAVEARAVLSDLQTALRLNVTNVRIFNRYDADHLTEEAFQRAIPTAFSAEFLYPVTVRGGICRSVLVEPKRLQGLVVPKSDQELETVLVLPRYVLAPVKKGQRLGRAAFYHGDTLLDETAVVASDSVRLRNFGDSLSQFVVKLLKL